MYKDSNFFNRKKNLTAVWYGRNPKEKLQHQPDEHEK